MASNKKAINRELMYRKIMPTMSKPNDNTPPSYSEPPKENIISHNTDTNTPITPDILAKPIEPKNVKKTVLINVMENLVLEKIDSAIARFNCCQCDKCKKDIIALTLNKLPPKYMVFDKDRMMDIIAKQTSSDVTAALVQSILKVKNNPHH